jgi:hypothetical protein
MNKDRSNENESTKHQAGLKKEVIKHSSAIHIKNSINLLQRRTWNVLLANAFNELMENKTHRIMVKDLKETLFFDSKDDGLLKNSIEKLVGCVVTWNILGKDKKKPGWAATSLLAQAEVKDGFCTYAYSELLKSKLFNPSMYARINLSMQNKFTSKHSLVLYELCLDYLKAQNEQGETPKILIEAFRELMGIEDDQYLNFKYFNKQIIKIAVDEVNKLSDLEIKVYFFREVRRIVALKFYIKKKKSFPRLLPAGKVAEEIDKNSKKSPNSGVEQSLDKLVSLLRVKTETLQMAIASNLAKSGFDYVRSNILYANENAKLNYVVYLKRSLKNDWALERREESAFKIRESQQKDEEWMMRCVEKNAAAQLSIGLHERFMSLDKKMRDTLLHQAKTRVLGSKYRDFLLRKEHKAFLEKVIHAEAINEMKS